MAKKYHPDTNKEPSAKDQFSDAQSAYELLSDPKKKQTWDEYGAAAFNQGSGFDPNASSSGPRGPFASQGGFGGFGASGGFGNASGFGPDINFEDLFGAFTGGARRNRGSRTSPFEQEEVLIGDNIEVQTNISFMDAATGSNKDIFITPLTKCKTCHGSGLKEGQRKVECKKCDGSGTRVHFMQAGFQMASTCEACGGIGMTVPRGAECRTCYGQGVVRERKTVNIDIPAGVEDGMRLRVSGEGDAPATGTTVNTNTKATSGDLYVFIRVAPDSKFSRSGADILYMASIPLTTAILGGLIRVPTLDGEVKLKVGTGTSNGDKVTLSGMGMPKLGGRRKAFGDLRVEFRVAMPKYLTSNQRVMLEMLADEFDDRTARRTMNVGSSRSSEPRTGEDQPKSDGHKNESFLKSAWHRLTHQHENADVREPEPQNTPPNKSGIEEPKKAAGSGS